MKRILLLAALWSFVSCDSSSSKAPDVSGTTTQKQERDSVFTDTLSLNENPRPATPVVDRAGTLPFTYDLDQPDAKFKLPGRLNEISGLGLSEDGAMLITVNDEQGKLFYLDKNTCMVVREFKFAKWSDYEGVELVDGQVYVVNSSGTLYKVKHPGEKNQHTKTYNTSLHRANDVEGLAFDKAGHRLLIACKGKPGRGDELKGKRAIYSFNLDSKELSKEPLFVIDREEIKTWRHREKTLARQVIGYLDENLADDAFAPSGIAIHPLSGEVYVLSSVGKCLVVLDATGNILRFEPLNPDLHRQPEGICFDEDGTLFISDEAKGGRAKVYRYIPKNIAGR